MSAAIVFECVSREYRTPARVHRVLNDVSLLVKEGEFVVVTGPSGSGKSTFLGLCALLDRPDSGEVRIGDRATASLSDDRLARLRGRAIGIVLQSFALFPRRSVLDNVLFRFRYTAAPDADGGVRQARRAVSDLGLSHLVDQKVQWLSGGELQRVAIARAVALPPQVLIADEPTGNLDAQSAGGVMECFRRLHRERGITVLLATHNLSLLKPGDRHLVCREGALVEAA
jgi:putative ABC transport system ATP-binding protein